MREMKKNLVAGIISAIFLSSFVFAINFSDISDHWGQEYIESAWEQGFVTGYEDDTYKPNQELTGNEFAVMITSAFLGESLYQQIKEGNSTTDGNWATPYVNTFLDLEKTVEGMEELFAEIDFNRSLTRISAAHMVGVLIESQNYSDHTESEIMAALEGLQDGTSYEGASFLGLVVHYQFMEGMPDGNFHGSDSLTRAEAAVILDNMANSSVLQLDRFSDYPREVEIFQEEDATGTLVALSITLIVSILFSIWLRYTYLKEIKELKTNLTTVQERLFEKKKELEETREELKESQLRNEELEELLEQFRILLAHELQVPVAVVKGYADLLLEDMVPEEETQKEYLRKIIDRSNYISDVLFAQLALITRQTLVIQAKSLDLIALCQQMVEDISHTASGRGIVLCVLPWDGEPMVQGDPHLIINALYNIIENSMKYMGREGIISIRFEEKNNFMEVCIRDDGLGLDSEETNHIFELNYQGSNRMEGKGFGHGLHMVQQSILKMNGKIWANSSPGKGMAITIAIPRAPQLSIEGMKVLSKV